MARSRRRTVLASFLAACFLQPPAFVSQSQRSIHPQQKANSLCGIPTSQTVHQRVSSGSLGLNPRHSSAFVALGVALLGLAPWLRTPKNLDEAYGFKKKQAQEAKISKALDDDEPVEVKRPIELPALQQPFRQRLRNIEPYEDIAKQIEQNFHGKGGFRKEREAQSKLFKLKPGQKKPPPPTEVDIKATQLATSRCWGYAQGSLQHPNTWPEPDPKFPEVCFVGRSNVGKSSLLNRVSQFGTVAAVSSMPGRTKHVSWYRNRKVKLDVIDMPGYGHSDRAKVFGPDALKFVKARKSLKCIYVLIDARHGVKWTDHEWLSELGNDGPAKQVILTKCDMVPPKMLLKTASLVRSDLEMYKRVEKKLFLCSSLYQHGMHDIRVDICRRCGVLGAKTEGDNTSIPLVRRDDLPRRAVAGQPLPSLDAYADGDDDIDFNGPDLDV